MITKMKYPGCLYFHGEQKINYSMVGFFFHAVSNQNKIVKKIVDPKLVFFCLFLLFEVL